MGTSHRNRTCRRYSAPPSTGYLDYASHPTIGPRTLRHVGAHYRRTNNICPIGSSQRCTMFHFLCFPFVRFRQPGFYFSPQPTSTRLIPHSRRSRSVKYDQIKCFCYCDLLEQRVCGNIDGHSADCANFNLLDMSRCFSVRGCSQSIRNVYHTEKHTIPLFSVLLARVVLVDCFRRGIAT